MTRLLTFIVLCLTCFVARGQFTVQQPFLGQVIASSANYYPTNEPGAHYWWVSSDIPTNTLATNWVDRIQSVAYQNSAASAPTNSSSGVGFDGSHYLRPDTHYAIPMGTNASESVVLICAPVTPGTTWGPILSGDQNFGDNGGYGIFAKSDGNVYYWGTGGNGNIAKLNSGTTKDIIVTMQGSTIFTMATYTNGVLSVSTLYGLCGQKQGWLGYDPAVNNYYNGKVLEIIWYSNILSSASISNIHWYATNTYGFSP